MALRIYTTRLLGRDPKLVLHGGGNTSLKMRMRDLFGEEVEVLRVKSSGSDMAAVEPDSLRAVRLRPMRKLRALETIEDEELVGIERANLIDPAAPNPSVEMMLHAFLPHKFIDHTHATAVLERHRSARRREEMRRGFRRPAGFRALRDAGLRPRQNIDRGVRERKPSDGLILSKHGIVTFGDTAREAYERMIEMVSLAEDFIARNRKIGRRRARAGATLRRLAAVAPIVRGACSEKDERSKALGGGSSSNSAAATRF